MACAGAARVARRGSRALRTPSAARRRAARRRRALGLSLFGKEPSERRLADAHAGGRPDGVDDARACGARSSTTLVIEIGAAFVRCKAKCGGIGTMGTPRVARYVLLLLSALEQVLRHEGWPVHRGDGVDAALDHYRSAGAAASPEHDDGVEVRSNVDRKRPTTSS